jgi:hypothetical protein
MPGKSRHARHKSSRSKKRKDRQASPAVAVQRPAVAQTSEPVAPARVQTPAVSTPTRYPYIVTELRTIGILAGIMLVILVVLALVLP